MPTYPYLTQVVHKAARARPAEPCLIYQDRRTGNARFAERVARLAGAFGGIGVGAGERVALVALNSDRLVESLFATFWAGGVACPLNVRWNVEELAFALNDCGAAVLLVDDVHAPLAAELRDRVPTLRACVHMGDGAAPDGLLAYEDLVELGPVREDAGRSGDDPAYLLYTGGTTGSPKGVLLSHANLVAASTAMLAAGCGTGERYLHAPPLFHVAGVQVMTAHFLGGQGPQVIIPAFEPRALMAAIQEHRVTDVMLVPTMLQMVLGHPDRAAYRLDSIEQIFYGAAPMTQALLRAAMAAMPSVGFVQGYGMTETALTIMLPAWYHTEEGQLRGKMTSIGQPLPTADVVIRDPQGHEVPRGVVGELTVKSPSVMLGYHERPELTAQTVRDGWLHSGDGAYMDDDGFVHLVDRLKDMIITGGENVYSSEVESALTEHAGVAVCAVIGVPDETWGERVHAVVVPAPGALPTAEELIAHCRARLAGFKCPRSVQFVEALPVSAAGKILKTRLRAAHRP
ncbi:long-chain-fatty-acid--CoA ligase [Streptomyces physcomitrii]